VADDLYGRQETEAFPEQSAPAGTTTRRPVEPLPLVAGVLFILIAVLSMAGVHLPIVWFSHGIAWVVLIGAGVALLVNELVKARRRR
jgi:hypothetical protein